MDSIKKLQQWDKRYLWHPFTQMQEWEDPLIIVSGKGSYLKDLQGNRYLDGVSSLWVNVHGHRVPEIDQAIRKQLASIGHSTLLGLASPRSIELARKIIQISPKGLTKVFYSDNGSTACEIALKMAYQFWKQTEEKSKRKYFITFSEAYHGDTIGSVSVGGIELFHQVYRSLLFPVIRFPSPYHAQQQGRIKELIEKIEQTLRTRHREIIGVFMEPLIQAAAGMLMHPKGFLKKIRKLCDQYNVLLILDEVATGFGRTGKMFACQHEGVVPDLMAVAKGLSGGYLPLAATLTSSDIYRGFLGNYAQKKTFFHGHTYTGNPLACAAAIANIELFQKNRILKSSVSKIRQLEKGLKKFREIPNVGQIRQCGMMVGIELVKNKKTMRAFQWEEKIGIKVIHEARKRGAILRPLGNVIVLMPPLSIRDHEIRRLLEITYQSIRIVMSDMK